MSYSLWKVEDSQLKGRGLCGWLVLPLEIFSKIVNYLKGKGLGEGG